MKRPLFLLAGLIASLAGTAVLAGTGDGPCRDVQYQGIGYTVCTVSAGDDLRIWQNLPSGTPYGSFEEVNAALAPEGKQLAFAMNGGMYHPDRQPVGLTIVGGKEVHQIVTSAGPGNFGLLPNGVFCIADPKTAKTAAGTPRFSVVESRAFAKAPPACQYATQSGPMLVIDGALHPKFKEDSDSTHIRNGVGVSADGKTAYFAISDSAVTFHDFASFFRDDLKTPNALYLDGSISLLYAPGLGREDIGLPLGPIIGMPVPRG